MDTVVRESFLLQAAACDALGSPFTARLCNLLGDRLQPGGAVADRILAWQGNPAGSADALALRLAGSLHKLVLENMDLGLKTAYPPNEVDDEHLWNAITSALEAHAEVILARLESAPQTNEVRRSGALLPGFLTLAHRFALPLVLSEVGASAGLNLHWDSYRYMLGGVSWGNPRSKVVIAPEWRGEPSPLSSLTVEARAACDLNPLNPQSSEDRLRLLSYVWADQFDRLERAGNALDIAAASGIHVERADAVEWLSRRLATRIPGRLHVIYHTIAWQYLPAELKLKGEMVIADAGRSATNDAPLARLALESDNGIGGEGASITLQMWPTGKKQEIGRADFHGRWVHWRGWQD